LALGGTFDNLHAGHGKTIQKAFSLSEKVSFGLATDSLAASLGKKPKAIPYADRKKTLKKFLLTRGLTERAEVIPIKGRYGVAHTLRDLEAIMVSTETHPIALEINRERERCGLKKLKIVVLKKLLAEDGKPISSTRIRRGEIDLQGRVVSKS